MTRHIGRHKATDRQIVVSWMLLPNQIENALATFPDELSETLRRELMGAVSSADAQRTDILGDLLGRKMYADSGKGLLQVLHEAKKLVTMPIDDIVMTPDGNHRLELRSVLEAIQAIPAPDNANKFNPHTYNTVTEGQQEQIGIAHNLLAEAKMLEADANFKRQQAYQLAPSLNPANSAEAKAVQDLITPDKAKAAPEADVTAEPATDAK